MNSIPKQQDGDGTGAAAANGSIAPLEQTVMGVAPAALGSTPAAAAPSQPPAVSGPASAPAPSSAIVAVPMIAVSDAETPVAPPVDVNDTPVAGLRETMERVPVDGTLRVVPVAERAVTPATAAAPSQQQTALSSDYLRAAREAALGSLAEKAPAESGGRAIADTLVTGTHPTAARDAAEPDLPPASERTRPSLAPPMPSATIPPSPPSMSSTGTNRGFEPVPVVRAPLSETLSGGLLPVLDLGGPRTLSKGLRPRPRLGSLPGGEKRSRWMLYCAVALAVVGVASFSGQLLNRYRNATERRRALSANEEVSPGRNGSLPASEGASPTATRALLANRPASELGALSGRATVVSVPSIVPAPGADGVEGASPESQLAATAGRHMLAGSYAEALPVYRQLARDWPANTAYAAMARLLEKRVGSSTDTRTVAPAEPGGRP